MPPAGIGGHASPILRPARVQERARRCATRSLRISLPDQADHELGAFRTVRLPEFAEGAPLLAGTEATSGPATLTLAADAKLEIDVLTYATSPNAASAPRPVPIDRRLRRAVDQSLGLELLFALSPGRHRDLPRRPAQRGKLRRLGRGNASGILRARCQHRRGLGSVRRLGQGQRRCGRQRRRSDHYRRRRRHSRVRGDRHSQKAVIARPSLLALSCWALLGCGTNRPEIPDELKSSGNAYGSEQGDTVQNFCFVGFRDPTTASFDPADFETVCFYDYHDPNGTKGYALLIVNTAAVWCQACKVEHTTLPDRYTALAPRGLALLSALFDDKDSNPAQPVDLSAWILSFDVNFPMVLDPEYQMGLYGSRDSAPLNLLIDTRTMVILKKEIGDNPAVLWPFVEDQLAQRGR